MNKHGLYGYYNMDATIDAGWGILPGQAPVISSQRLEVGHIHLFYIILHKNWTITPMLEQM